MTGGTPDERFGVDVKWCNKKTGGGGRGQMEVRGWVVFSVLLFGPIASILAKLMWL